MDDDWKGEHFIKARDSWEQRKSEKQRIISAVYHKKRRGEGVPSPGARKHKALVDSVFRDKE